MRPNSRRARGSGHFAPSVRARRGQPGTTSPRSLELRKAGHSRRPLTRDCRDNRAAEFHRRLLTATASDRQAVEADRLSGNEPHLDSPVAALHDVPRVDADRGESVPAHRRR